MGSSEFQTFFSVMAEGGIKIENTRGSIYEGLDRSRSLLANNKHGFGICLLALCNDTSI